MTTNFEGPSNSEIDRILRALKKAATDRASRFIGEITKEAARAIIEAYMIKIYRSPLGVFGYPKSQAPKLAQAVQAESKGLSGIVFTNQPEAVFVEYGTGLFNTAGTKKKIKPKGGKKYLSFPVWRLPPHFKGIFVSAKKSSRGLPFGAIGRVLAKESAGMPARPVWNDPDVLDAINSLVREKVKYYGFSDDQP